MTFETNVQSDSFYQEANDMSPGWGETLRSIDKLRDKFDRNEDITLNDACYILWAEKGVCSDTYLKFKDYMEKYSDRKMPWPAWYGMFENWVKNK